METTISLPKFPKLVKVVSPNRAVFEIEDLYPGYGLTIGNALRRVIFSSLPGAAITAIKIKDVNHEFSTLPSVLENIVEVILNLKQVRFKIHADEPQIITLKVKGEKEVKASDIKLNSQIEIFNPKSHIATLTSKSAALEIEMKVEKGLGYSSIESRKKEKQEVGNIAVDAIFTPIKKMNYEVEDMRVGDRTDFNRLIIDIETDGTITPAEALTMASNLLIDHFKITASPIAKIASKETVEKPLINEAYESTEEEKEMDILKTKVEDLKLSNRTQNILLNNHIKTVSGILKMAEKDLLSLEGVGDKAVKEVKKALGKLGLTLKQE